MDFVAALSGGDRRSIGRANEIVAHVLKHRAGLGPLVDAIDDEDPVVRMRAADALEKVSSKRPLWTAPYAERFIRLARKSDQQEVRWHMAQVLARLDLTPSQANAATRILFTYLEDRSRIVRISAITTLAAFAARDKRLRTKVTPLIEQMARTGSAAERARARKLSL